MFKSVNSFGVFFTNLDILDFKTIHVVKVHANILKLLTCYRDIDILLGVGVEVQLKAVHQPPPPKIKCFCC